MLNSFLWSIDPGDIAQKLFKTLWKLKHHQIKLDRDVAQLMSHRTCVEWRIQSNFHQNNSLVNALKIIDFDTQDLRNIHQKIINNGIKGMHWGVKALLRSRCLNTDYIYFIVFILFFYEICIFWSHLFLYMLLNDIQNSFKVLKIIVLWNDFWKCSKLLLNLL